MFEGEEGLWAMFHAADRASMSQSEFDALKKPGELVSADLTLHQALVLQPMTVHGSLHDAQQANAETRQFAAYALMMHWKVGLFEPAAGLDDDFPPATWEPLLNAIKLHLFHDDEGAFERVRGVARGLLKQNRGQTFPVVTVNPKGDTTTACVTLNSFVPFDQLAKRVDPQGWDDTSRSFVHTCLVDDGQGQPLKCADFDENAPHGPCLTTEIEGDYTERVLHEEVGWMGLTLSNDLCVSYTRDDTAKTAEAKYRLLHSHDGVLAQDGGFIRVKDKGDHCEVEVEKTVQLTSDADPVLAFAIRVLLRAWVTLETWLAFGRPDAMGPSRPDPPTTKKKVLVLGGGAGGLAAAYHLSRTENLRASYDVTVVEASFAPGGKTSSARDRQGRILEHGLHMFFGAYENTWRMMNDVWAAYPSTAGASGRTLRIGTVDEAFEGRCLSGFAGEGPFSPCTTWWLTPPKLPGTPGVPLPPATAPTSLASSASGPMTVFHMLWGIAQQLEQVGLSLLMEVDRALGPHHLAGGRFAGALTPAQLRCVLQGSMVHRDQEPPEDAQGLADCTRSPCNDEALQEILDALVCLEKALFPELDASLSSELEGLAPFYTVLENENAAAETGQVDDASRPPTPWVDARLRPGTLVSLVRAAGNVRNLLQLAQLGVAVFIGLLRERAYVPPNAVDPTKPAFYERLNDQSIHCFLQRSGFDELQFPILRAFHSGLFAYKEGDEDGADLAAGVALNAMMRTLFSYKGHMLYQMQSGMGEVVVAPTFKVLLDRGVTFELLHRVDKISADEDGVTEVSIIPLTQDALDPQGATKWQELGPLSAPREIETFPDAFTADGVTWRMHDAAPTPEEPRAPVIWERGAEGDASFDHVVIALPPPVLRKVMPDETTRELLGLKALLGDHEDDTGVCTIGFQAWLTKTPAELGWPGYPPIIGGLGLPIDTWSDMRHLLAMEPPSDAKAKALNYHVGVRAPPEGEMSQAAVTMKVGDDVTTWLVGADGSALFGPDVTDSEDHRYVAASSDRADDYTLAAAGTINHRPHPEGWEGVAFAGDWTRNSVACGCVESAVTSGARAARGLVLRDGFVAADAPDVAFEWDLVYHRGYTKKVE